MTENIKKYTLIFLLTATAAFAQVKKEDNDGKDKKSYLLNKPNIGLHIPTGIWRELENFSSGAVCLVLASDIFEEADYIRDYDEFFRTK